MVEKPSEFPDWATEEQVDSVSGQTNRVAPPSESQESGWTRREIPPRQWWNWTLWTIGRWIRWAEDRIELLQDTQQNLGTAAFEDDIRYAHRANNLSDLDDASAGRDNLGLGSAAQADTGTAPSEVPTNGDLGTAAFESDTRYAHRSNNLSDLDSASEARDNLGLGSASVEDDTRYAHRTNNLSDLSNAATARSNLEVLQAGTGGVQARTNDQNDGRFFRIGGSYELPFAAGVLSFDDPDNLNLKSNRNNTAERTHFEFSNPNGAVGSISTSGTATSYNTSSDYRLKCGLSALGGYDAVKSVPVYELSFMSSPDVRIGAFLAHEVQEIIPEAVTGEKDAIDDCGDPVYQSMDYSKMTPYLWAAMQEAITKIEYLETELARLKGA